MMTRVSFARINPGKWGPLTVLGFKGFYLHKYEHALLVIYQLRRTRAQLLSALDFPFHGIAEVKRNFCHQVRRSTSSKGMIGMLPSRKAAVRSLLVFMTNQNRRWPSKKGNHGP